MRKVLFDNTHKEGVELKFTGDQGLSFLVRALEEIGYSCHSLEDRARFNMDTFTDHDVLFIAYPKERFSQREKENVLDFLKADGGLILAAEWGNIENNADILNDLGTELGIKFNKDRIADSKESFEEEVKLLGDGVKMGVAPHMPKITEFADHPITKGLKVVGHFSGCSIDAPESEALAWSSRTSFGDLNADGEVGHGEHSGHLITSAHPHSKGGRVVAIGDTSIFTNRYIRKGDSKKFVTNAIRWLAKDL